MAATAADVIRVARSYLGYVEQGGRDGKSGNLTIFGKWFGLDGNPWCDMYVSFCFYRAGVQHGSGKGFAYCPTDQAWWTKQGRLHHTPQVGDQVFYGFGHTSPVHTGIVVKVTGPDTFDAIEGNTAVGNDANGGEVMIRQRRVSDTTGFGRPAYAASSSSQTAAANKVKPNPKQPVQHRQLALTSPLTRGADVTWVQNRLIALKYLPKGSADSVYGPHTAGAVKAFQKSKGLRQDGVTGPNTWHALGA